jgi:iron complex outermembrane receptor protein
LKCPEAVSRFRAGASIYFVEISVFHRILLLSAAAVVAPACAQQVYSPENTGGVEMVVVTASPLNKRLDDTASITAQISRDDILQSGGGNLADALANIPGVSGSGFAAGASRPIIRGMDSSRVKLVENGLSSSDVSDIGPDHGVPIDPLSTQNIEVVRGAATLRYGSQAIGGVVNAINNRVPTALPDKTFSGESSVSYASVANTGEASVLADMATGKFALHADAFYRNAGNYDTPLGTQDNSFFVGNGFALGSSYFFDDNNRTGAAVIQYDAKYGIPSDTAFILMRQTKFLSRSSFNIGYGPLGALNIDGVYANYSHEEKNPDGSVNTTFKNKELDTRAEQLLGAIGPFSSAAVGLEVQNREYSAVGLDSSYLFPTVTNTVAGYVFTEAPLAEALHLESSARVENVRISGTPASDVHTERDFTPLSAAVGLLIDAADWLKLGVTASTAGRAPAQTELFARGGHDGPGTFETGDPTLKIERANSLEGTARLRFPDVTVDFSVWSSWFDNYIYGQLTGRTCDNAGICAMGGPGDLKELNYVQTGAHFRGLEGKGTYKLWDSGSGVLSAEFQGDYVRATLNGGSNVPHIPPYRLGGGLTWESDAFDAGVRLMVNGRQKDFGAFDTPTPSYTELNANIAWRPFPSAQGIQFDLVGHNLTDAVERNAASFNKDVVVMPGRDIRLVLRATL